MSKNQKLKFNCSKCGSNKLAYQKYVKCTSPVSIKKNNHIEYGLSTFDEDDYLNYSHYICLECGEIIRYCGFRLETEKSLLNYLQLDPKVREQQQTEFEENYKAVTGLEEEPGDIDDLLAIMEKTEE